MVLPFQHLSLCTTPLLRSCAHHLPRRLGEPPGLGSLTKSIAGRRVSAQLSPNRRRGWCARPTPPWCPRGPPGPGGRHGHSGCPGCQTSGAFHVGRGDVIQVARIQGGAFFPSGFTYRPCPPSAQKRISTQKTFATLLIYSLFLPLSQWATSCRTPE